MTYIDPELDELGETERNPFVVIQEDCEELRCRKFEVKCELHDVVMRYAV